VGENANLAAQLALADHPNATGVTTAEKRSFQAFKAAFVAWGLFLPSA
jgi:hypothetical protein